MNTDYPEVTWAPTYFANQNITLQVQGDYQGINHEGFTSGQIPVGQGYYVWQPNISVMANRRLSTLSVRFYLSYFDSEESGTNNTAAVTRVAGPIVTVSNNTTPVDEESSGGNSSPGAAKVVTIAVPVVLAVVFLIILGLCLWSWRRHGHVPLIGSRFSRKSRQGYGIGKSGPQRVGSGVGQTAEGDQKISTNVGIQLTERDSWSPRSPRDSGNTVSSDERRPAQERNVFREELRRQEMER
jgi:hypothetical protein